MLALVALYHDSLHEAGQLLERALGDVGEHLALRVQTLVALSFARLNTGDLAGALRIAEDAVTGAERLGYPPLLSQALTMAVHLRFRLGEGLDEPSLQRAVQLEDPNIDMPAVLHAAQQVGVQWYFIEDESPTSETQIPQSLHFLETVKF